MRLQLLGTLFLLPLACMAQGSFTWFNASSETSKDLEVLSAGDCYLAKEETLSPDKGIFEFEAFPLFIYNHPQIRKWMKNEYMMKATAKVNRTGDNHFVIIKFVINSDKAKYNYGNLEKDGKIKVTLLNEDHIYLQNIERDRGKVRRTSKKTTYTGTYAVDKDDLKKLKKHSIDKITVLWEEGVEEYQVQNIDLIKQQLICLEEL